MKLCGIDVGTTGVKAAVFSEFGELLGYGMETYDIELTEDGRAQQNGELVWIQTKKAIQTAVAQSGSDIDALSVSVQGDALLLVDRQGELLAPVQLGMDYRAAVQAETLSARFGRREIFRRTGMVPHPLCFFPKLMWVAQHQPELLERSWKAVTYDGFLFIRLCGTAVTDATMAGRTMAVDLASGDWDSELLAAAPVSREKLAKVVPPGTPVGTVSKEIAREVGIDSQTVVVAGGHDQTCAALGAGLSRPGLALDSHGTAEVVSTVLNGPLLGTQMFQEGCPCYPHVVPGKYFTFGLNHTGGISLQWLKGILGAGSYEELMSEMPSSPTSLLFLPALLPDERGARLGTVAGFTLSTTRGELAKALLEGLGFEMLRFLNLFEQSGSAIEELRCVGGGARSPVGLQLKADLYNRPVSALQVREAACLGAALLAGRAVGAYASLEEGICRAVRLSKTYYPQPENKAFYMEKFKKYLSMRQDVAEGHWTA